MSYFSYFLSSLIFLSFSLVYFLKEGTLYFSWLHLQFPEESESYFRNPRHPTEWSDAKCVLFSFVYAGTKDSLFSENVVVSVRKFSKKNTLFKTRRNLVSDDSFRKKVACPWMDDPRFKTMLHHRQRFHLKWP